MKSHNDPILEEIRAYRRAYAAHFDYDIDAILEDIKFRESISGREIVYPPDSKEDPAPQNEAPVAGLNTPEDDDPILEEIRAYRRAYAAHFDYDIDAILEDIKFLESISGREIVYPPDSKEDPAPQNEAPVSGLNAPEDDAS